MQDHRREQSQGNRELYSDPAAARRLLEQASGQEAGKRHALILSAIAATATLPAQAQEAEQIDTIVVTGSRIAIDPNLVTSAPVTQIKADEIVYRGITRVEDLVNDMPQITPELTANDSNGATGTATVDLRGLGSDRTLVLTNGHRMGYPFMLAPDVNQVPAALIERVELLTGGASSTYGSDAVAGVVNFIMRDDFEGFQIDYQYSGYSHSNDNGGVQDEIAANGFEQAPSSVSDGSTTSINLILGVNTDDGRGNVTGYLGYRDINAIKQSERDFSACSLDTDAGDICVGSATSAEGLFAPFDGVTYFTVEGNEFVEGLPYYNFGPLNYFQRPDERFTAGVFGRYEIGEHLEGYAEAQFMGDRSLAQIEPSGVFFNNTDLSCDNPLLSAQQIQMINDAGYPCGPGLSVPFYVGRRNVEGGPRFDDLRHTSYRLLGGFRGDITENWSYDAFANFSRLVYSETYNNDLSVTRIVRALDVVSDPVTGDPVCQSVVDGSDSTCVPWNVFQEGGVTQEAIDYLSLPLFSKAQLNQDQFVAFVTGDLGGVGLVSPAAEDGVKVVLGGEYRGERFDFDPDQGFQSGDGAGQGGPIPPVAGEVNVTEFFTEFHIPIAQNRTMLESLSLDLRYRYSDYSTDVTTDTYNIGGEWTPVSGLKFRGGYSRAVRAANIRELFEPQNLGLWSGTDPCGGATPQLTEAECANTGVRPGQYGSIALNPAGQYNAIFGGNTDLDPEESDSYTVGLVFTADQWVPSLSLSVDYWSIEVTDAISFVDPETTIRQCAATADPALCDLVNRAPNGNLWVGEAGFVTSTNVNIGFIETSGFDVAANYRWDIGNWGGLSFSYRGTVLDSYDEQELPGAEVVDCAGIWGGSCGRPRPEYKHTFVTTWTSPWNLTLVGGWRHVGSADELRTEEDVPYFDAGSEDYLDLAATWTPEWGFGEGTTFSLGVSNALDNDPPFNGRFSDVEVYGNGNTIPGTWDSLGATTSRVLPSNCDRRSRADGKGRRASARRSLMASGCIPGGALLGLCGLQIASRALLPDHNDRFRCDGRRAQGLPS
jgi:iron complex outermembrane recepter protein